MTSHLAYSPIFDIARAILLAISPSGSARNRHVQAYAPVAARWRQSTSLRR